MLSTAQVAFFSETLFVFLCNELPQSYNFAFQIHKKWMYCNDLYVFGSFQLSAFYCWFFEDCLMVCGFQSIKNKFYEQDVNQQVFNLLPLPRWRKFEISASIYKTVFSILPKCTSIANRCEPRDTDCIRASVALNANQGLKINQRITPFLWNLKRC